MSEGEKPKLEVPQAFHYLEGPAAVDAIFGWAAELGKLVVATGKAKSEARAERRRSKARSRYAMNKQLGIPNRKLKAKPAPEREYEPMTSCQCAVCGMPPCWWCENGGCADVE